MLWTSANIFNNCCNISSSIQRKINRHIPSILSMINFIFRIFKKIFRNTFTFFDRILNEEPKKLMIVCWNSPILCFNNKQFLNEVKGKFPDKKGNNHFELSTLATDNKIINRNQCSRRKSSFLGENVFCGFCWCFAHRFIWEGDFLHYLYSLSPELWKCADGLILSALLSVTIFIFSMMLTFCNTEHFISLLVVV